MKNTLVYDESKPAINHRAIGFNSYGEKADYTILTVGAGGIFSTVEDLFKWDQALYTEKLIKQKTLHEAFTPGKLNTGKNTSYGFGWGIIEKDGDKMVLHAGGLAAFRTFIVRRINTRDTIILLTNNENNEINRISSALANIFDGKPFQLPKLTIGRVIYKFIKKIGIDAAIDKYHDLKKNNQKDYRFHEVELNALGYRLMTENKMSQAIKIFKLNVEAYPKAWNVYDSLGEAYMKTGKTKLAIKYYQKSVELNPKNKGGITTLKKLKEKGNSTRKK